MKIMLIVPTHKYKEYPTPLSLSDFPTGFAYLASSLNGHEVIGVNPNNLTGYPSGRIMLQEVLREKIGHYRPDLIGMGGLATDYAFLVDCIALCRGLSDAPIVLGGQIVTNDAEDIMGLLKPDYAIVGEGEEVMVRLVDALGQKKPVEDIPNLWYWG